MLARRCLARSCAAPPQLRCNGPVLHRGYGATVGAGELPYRDGDGLAYTHTPMRVLGGPYKQITCGSNFACALLTSGQARCW